MNARTLRHFSCLLCAIVLSAASSVAQDKSKYYTVMHPDEFNIDWTGFYETVEAKTAETRKELPHHLDLAYGAHPKQKLDLYLPKEKPYLTF